MTLEPIEIVTVIDRAPAEVFDAFVSRMSDWWPLESHSVGPYLGEAAPEQVMVERHEGGRISEVSARGDLRLWGVFTTYEAGKALGFTWHPGLDSALATQVDVRFDATDDGKTLVTLTHAGWDVRGDDAAAVRGNYVLGWDDIIKTRFSEFVETRYMAP